MDPRARRALKVIGKILLATLRAITLVILLAAWAVNALPKGKGRSQCALAKAFRSWNKDMIKSLLPRTVAAHIR